MLIYSPLKKEQRQDSWRVPLTETLCLVHGSGPTSVGSSGPKRFFCWLFGSGAWLSPTEKKPETAVRVSRWNRSSFSRVSLSRCHLSRSLLARPFASHRSSPPSPEPTTVARPRSSRPLAAAAAGARPSARGRSAAAPRELAPPLPPRLLVPRPALDPPPCELALLPPLREAAPRRPAAGACRCVRARSHHRCVRARKAI